MGTKRLNGRIESAIVEEIAFVFYSVCSSYHAVGISICNWDFQAFRARSGLDSANRQDTVVGTSAKVPSRYIY